MTKGIRTLAASNQMHQTLTHLFFQGIVQTLTAAPTVAPAHPSGGDGKMGDLTMRWTVRTSSIKFIRLLLIKFEHTHHASVPKQNVANKMCRIILN